VVAGTVVVGSPCGELQEEVVVGWFPYLEWLEEAVGAIAG